ncbi:MAG TPA: hypothetical protein VEV15_01005 [Flavisolibacter sp.]|nr:hypothetical protein [Flavisolibacter sp.]
MDAVVAKFSVTSIEDFGANKTVKLRAVYDKDGANKDFTKYTPYGEMTIGITSEAPASSFFAPGQTLTLTFSKE